MSNVYIMKETPGSPVTWCLWREPQWQWLIGRYAPAGRYWTQSQPEDHPCNSSCAATGFLHGLNNWMGLPE